MRQVFTIFIICLLCTFSACTQTSPLTGHSSHIEIGEEIYFVEGGDEKINAYLMALQAQSVSLTELYDEEAESYSLNLSIVKSKKFQDKSDQDKQVIAYRIAELLVNHVDYASYYTEIRVSTYPQALSEEIDEEAEANWYTFPMSNWFEDQ